MRTKISILLILISLLGYSQQQPTWFGGGVRFYNATEQTSFSLGHERIPLMQTNGVINSFIHSDSLVVQSQIKPFITISDVPVYQAGSNVTIDNTNPLSPIINALGSGGGSSNTFSNGITLLSGNAKIGGELIDSDTRLNIDDNTKSFGIFANTFPSTSETIKTGVRIKGNELLLQAGLLSDSIQVNGRVKLKNFIDFRNGGSSTNIYFGTGYGAAQSEDIFIASTPSEPMIITVGDDSTYDVTLKDNVFTSPNAVVNKQYVDNAVLSSSLPVGFYQEGSFTPTLTNSEYGGVFTTSSYVRVGNLVKYNIYIFITSTTGTPGTFNIQNMPFDPVPFSNSVDLIELKGSSFNTQQLETLVSSLTGSGSIVFRDNLDITANLSGIIFTNGIIRLSGSYITNVYTP